MEHVLKVHPAPDTRENGGTDVFGCELSLGLSISSCIGNMTEIVLASYCYYTQFYVYGIFQPVS